MGDTTAETPATDPNAGAEADASAPADPMHVKMTALRAKLENARSRIIGGRRQNMLDQIADGCCDAIDAFLSMLPPG